MIELDHLVLPVPDLDAAATELAGAGFIVTPVARHPFGTANRLVVFDHVYVELVSVVDESIVPESGFARTVSDHLRLGRTGFSHFACRAGSVTEAGAAIREQGLEASEPMWFSRPAPRSDGSELVAGFTLLPIVGHPDLFFCVHHTPEAVWFRPHLTHPNGARAVTEVSADPAPEVFIAGVTLGSARIALDEPIEPVDVSGVAFG